MLLEGLIVYFIRDFIESFCKRHGKQAQCDVWSESALYQGSFLEPFNECKAYLILHGHAFTVTQVFLIVHMSSLKIRQHNSVNVLNSLMQYF